MANDYGQLTARAARQYGIPLELFRKLVSAESGGNQAAISPAGAIGLTQLMPKTAAGLGVDPHDPAQNLLGGAKYLRQQYDTFKRWDLALAAYNAGPNAVRAAGGIPNYPETQAYVRSILSGVRVKAAPSPAGLQQGFDTLAGETQAPDLTGAVVANLSEHNPLQQLTNLTNAVAMQGGPTTVMSAEAMPAAAARRARPNLGPVKFTGVSLSGTNPTFAEKVSQAAAAVGATRIRLDSAHRTPATNTGVANSNHLYGHAFDGAALINGKWVPLGVALLPVAAKYGLRSGDVPGFYKGAPDVEHVDDGFNLKHTR